jgi:hypothetical protein
LKAKGIETFMFNFNSSNTLIIQIRVDRATNLFNKSLLSSIF